MKRRIKNTKVRDLRDFLILWSTQSLSQLGSSMTAFALTLWLYEETGSALKTATLTICSYAPYVVMSIFAGALSDRFDKKQRASIVAEALFVCPFVGGSCRCHLKKVSGIGILMSIYVVKTVSDIG